MSGRLLAWLILAILLVNLLDEVEAHGGKWKIRSKGHGKDSEDDDSEDETKDDDDSEDDTKDDDDGCEYQVKNIKEEIKGLKHVEDRIQYEIYEHNRQFGSQSTVSSAEYRGKGIRRGKPSGAWNPKGNGNENDVWSKCEKKLKVLMEVRDRLTEKINAQEEILNSLWVTGKPWSTAGNKWPTTRRSWSTTKRSWPTQRTWPTLGTRKPWPTRSKKIWQTTTRKVWPTVTSRPWPTTTRNFWPTTTSRPRPTTTRKVWPTTTSRPWPTTTRKVWPTTTSRPTTTPNKLWSITTLYNPWATRTYKPWPTTKKSWPGYPQPTEDNGWNKPGTSPTDYAWVWLTANNTDYGTWWATGRPRPTSTQKVWPDKEWPVTPAWPTDYEWLTDDDYPRWWTTGKSTTDNKGWTTGKPVTKDRGQVSTPSPDDEDWDRWILHDKTTKTQPHYEMDCAEILSNNKDSQNGVYKISVPGIKDPIEVYCDMTTRGGGWTVIQRRKDGSTDFYRSWDEYAEGFGSADGEYWLGNNKLAALTVTKPYVLRIEMVNSQSEQSYAEYKRVVIGGSEFSYKLLSLGAYSGNTVDSLSYHVGQKFSTPDRDNDDSHDNCAQKFRGGWWYKYCFESNLNGDYWNNTVGQGVIWRQGISGGYPLRQVAMMIRPLSFERRWF